MKLHSALCLGSTEHHTSKGLEPDFPWAHQLFSTPGLYLFSYQSNSRHNEKGTGVRMYR